MEPQARYTVVGASVLALVALAVAAMVWMLSSGNGKEVHPYTLYFTRQSLEGLDVHSEVRLKGIRVGSVTSFAFSRHRPGSVEVAVQVDAAAPVRESTRAVVDRNLITGLAHIRLITLKDDSPLLRAQPGERHAVIDEGESQLEQFSATMSQLGQRADETMQRIGATLSPANLAALGETLENLRVASRHTGALMTRMDRSLASIARASDTLQESSQAATADLHRLAGRYDALGADADVGVREATTAVRHLSQDATRLAGRTQDLLGDVDIELRLTGQQLRSAADAVGGTSRKLGDPRAAFFGPSEASLGPGESRQ